MIRLYRAANLPEAHLIKDLLAQEGIESFVFNENAQSGAGQLPLTEIYPEVWVAKDRDLANARSVVQRFEKSATSPAAVDRVCGACGQMNPAGFEICWNCQALI